MRTTDIKRFFRHAMQIENVWCGNPDGSGEFVKVKPKLIVRNFDAGTCFPHCDLEFTNFNEVLKFIQNLNQFRIMNVTGHIYYCSMDEVEK